MFFSSKTLNSLGLYNNNIGQAGARYLAEALRQNKVTQESAFTFIFIYLLQTLSTFVIFQNEIGDEGIEHLADALHHNNVN